MTDELKIEQRHRDAAAKFAMLAADCGPSEPDIQDCLAGRHDDAPLVQVFAQFETDTLASQARQIKALREAVGWAVGWFTDYATMHRLKGTRDGLIKGERNQKRANQLRATLEETSRG